MSYAQDCLDEVLAMLYGPHLGGMMHAAWSEIRKQGYWTSIPEPDLRIPARFLVAAPDPMGLAERRSATGCLELFTEGIPYGVRLQLSVYGERPPYFGKPFLGIQRRAEWKGKAIQDMLHSIDPQEVVNKLIAGFALKTPPPSPKHWMPREKVRR